MTVRFSGEISKLLSRRLVVMRLSGSIWKSSVEELIVIVVEGTPEPRCVVLPLIVAMVMSALKGGLATVDDVDC